MFGLHDHKFPHDTDTVMMKEPRTCHKDSQTRPENACVILENINNKFIYTKVESLSEGFLPKAKGAAAQSLKYILASVSSAPQNGIPRVIKRRFL